MTRSTPGQAAWKGLFLCSMGQSFIYGVLCVSSVFAVQRWRRSLPHYTTSSERAACLIRGGGAVQGSNAVPGTVLVPASPPLLTSDPRAAEGKLVPPARAWIPIHPVLIYTAICTKTLSIINHSPQRDLTAGCFHFSASTRLAFQTGALSKPSTSRFDY